MGIYICPECGAVVQQSDTNCMDCGVNIADAERNLTSRVKQERGGGPAVGHERKVQGASAGVAEAGETS